MNKEIYADVYYQLNIETYLFAILVDHIDKDEVEISLQDFERKRIAFYNCGIRQVENCFTQEELIKWLNSKPNLFQQISYDRWIVKMNNIIDDIDMLSDEELEFVHHNEKMAKIFSLFCNLQIDSRLFDERGLIASLLHCNFLFDDPYSSHSIKK